MAHTESRLRSFEEMEAASGTIAAANAYFGAHGRLPEEQFAGQWSELVGDPMLDEDVETWIKINCSR